MVNEFSSFSIIIIIQKNLPDHSNMLLGLWPYGQPGHAEYLLIELKAQIL